MAIPFSRSIRALAAEQAGTRATTLAAFALVLLLVVWAGWACSAKVTLLEIGVDGRLESVHSAHTVGAPIGGRVISMVTELGRQVKKGDVLLELDAAEAEATQRQALVRHDALTAQIRAIEVEIDAVSALVAAVAQGSNSAVAEARAVRQRATTNARRARRQVVRRKQLSDDLMSEEARDMAASEASALHSEARAASLAVQRIAGEARTREADASVRLENLRRERARLIGERDAAATEIERLSAGLARRRITAPIAGTIGELAELRPGAVVIEGQNLLSIVPNGPLRAVAWFASSSALGRLRPGQLAHMRLEGFPWTTFGMVEMKVSRVGTETRKGRLRAELALERAPVGVPLAHGLEGSVEVSVEQVSPLELALRAVGQVLRTEPVAPVDVPAPREVDDGSRRVGAL